ncbi:MAG: hypothetical protein AAF846_28365 [Chloroflexota bacterium]
MVKQLIVVGVIIIAVVTALVMMSERAADSGVSSALFPAEKIAGEVYDVQNVYQVHHKRFANGYS